MSKAAIYIRTAVLSAQGVRQQRARCLGEAKRVGAKVDASFVFIDDGVHGNEPAARRPGYRRLEAAARAGAFNLLVIDDLARLSRSMSTLMEMLDAFSAAGVKVVAAGPIDALSQAILSKR